MTLTRLNTETLLNAAYQEMASAFDDIHAKQLIPHHVQSPLRPDEDSPVPCGITAAIHHFLTGLVQAQEQDDALRIDFQQGGASHSVWSLSATTPGTRSWATDATPQPARSVPLLALVEATQGRLPHTRRALLRLVNLLAQQQLRYPIPAASLTASTRLPQIRDAVYALADTLDAEVRQHLQEGSLTSGPVPARVPGTSWRPVSLARPLYPTDTRRKATPTQHLARLIKRGGAALLVGPPGTFKTQSAKEAATTENATLIIAKGSPSDEAADLLGGLYPGESGLSFVDGPVTRAFVSAAQQPTVLLIDEVLRYPAESMSVIIGALDPLGRDELVAMGLGAALSTHTRYYALSLRNGDQLVCPCAHLTVIMTTNLGADHHQVADRLDGALLSRLDLLIPA